MSDNVFQDTVSALDAFRLDAMAFNTFLTGAVGQTVNFTNAAGTVVSVPTLMSELMTARDRIPDPTGQPAGTFIAVNSANMPAYVDFAFNFPVAGQVRSNQPVVFNETAGGARTLDLLPYHLPLQSALFAGSLLVYDGANFVNSPYGIQNDGYLPGPATGSAAINRLAIVRSELATSGMTTRTYRESAIRIPTGAEIAMTENQNKFFLSSSVNGEAAIVQSSYQVPLNTTGTVEGSIMTLDANENLVFSSMSLTDIIIRDTPAANLDFIRISALYNQGRLEINRSLNLPTADPNDPDTFIDGSTLNNSQSKFVSASFLFDRTISNRDGNLVANFLGATDSMTHYINFGRIGINIISSTLPWAANRGNVANTAIIYRQHDLVLYLGRRYYVEFDVTPATNPVPGTNMTMSGVTVDPSPFTAYNCGIEPSPQASPFTAVNQLIYATVGDTAFVNPPAADGSLYVLELETINVGGINRLRPAWEVVPEEDPDAPAEQSVVRAPFDEARTRSLAYLSGILVNNQYAQTVTAYPARRNEATIGGFSNQAGRGAFGGLGFAPGEALGYDQVTSLISDHGVRGGGIGHSGSAFLGADGRLRFRVRTFGPSSFYLGWIPSASFALESYTLFNNSDNNDFQAIYDTGAPNNSASSFLFLRKTDNSLWMWGNERFLNTGSATTAATAVLHSMSLANVVKVAQTQIRAPNTSGTTSAFGASVVALDNSGQLHATGINFLNTPSSSPQATLNGFRRIVDSVPNIVDFDLGSTVIRDVSPSGIAFPASLIQLVFITSGGRAYLITSPNALDGRRAYWRGLTGTLAQGTPHILPQLNVVDATFAGVGINEAQQFLMVLTSSALFTTRYTSVYNAAAGRIETDAIDGFVRIQLPRNSRWSRISKSGLAVIDEDGRIAQYSAVTNSYRYI